MFPIIAFGSGAVPISICRTVQNVKQKHNILFQNRIADDSTCSQLPHIVTLLPTFTIKTCKTRPSLVMFLSYVFVLSVLFYGPIQTEILSQRAVRPKTTNLPICSVLN